MPSASQSITVREPGRPKSNILIVEDDPANAEVLDLLLHVTFPYQTAIFRSSHDVLTHLDIIRLLHPILFMLDYRLPPLTALDVYRRLHATEELADVPAIILSGGAVSDEEQASLFQQGLVFIPKPYDIDDIVATIEMVIG